MMCLFFGILITIFGLNIMKCTITIRAPGQPVRTIRGIYPSTMDAAIAALDMLTEAGGKISVVAA